MNVTESIMLQRHLCLILVNWRYFWLARKEKFLPKSANSALRKFRAFFQWRRSGETAGFSNTVKKSSALNSASPSYISFPPNCNAFNAKNWTKVLLSNENSFESYQLALLSPVALVTWWFVLPDSIPQQSYKPISH